MMRLNKEAGVNPLGGCLPALMQSVVFIGLFHVLRSFTTSYQLGVGNYFFSAADVQSFVDAKLFGGAPLSASMAMPQAQLDALGGDRATVILVGIPLTILAGIATHLTSRRSVGRQATMGVAPTGQTAIMNRLMMYGFPLFVVIGGPFFPLAILSTGCPTTPGPSANSGSRTACRTGRGRSRPRLWRPPRWRRRTRSRRPEPGRRTPSGRSCSRRRSTGRTPLQGTARRRTPRPATALARPVRPDP